MSSVVVAWYRASSHSFFCTFGELRFTNKVRHMTSFGERRYIEKDTSFVPALCLATVREITADRERCGTQKAPFTEIICFSINPNIWCS